MNPNKKFRDVLRHFDTAMLVTRSASGRIHARPMFIAACKNSGDMWFITSRQSEAADEIRDDEHVAVTMQSPSRYLSISGRATLIHDPQRVRDMWRPILYAWFEDRDDPRAVLVRLKADEAELWDDAGMRVQYVFPAVTAVSPGDEPDRAEVVESSAPLHL